MASVLVDTGDAIRDLEPIYQEVFNEKVLRRASIKRRDSVRSLFGYNWSPPLEISSGAPTKPCFSSTRMVSYSN